MKKYILFFLTFFSFSQVNGQNTWVQRLSYIDNAPTMNTDSLSGIKNLSIGADGDIYVAGEYGIDYDCILYKVSPTGAPVKWAVSFGYYHSPVFTFINDVHPTSDSGCIVCYNYTLLGCKTDGYLIKYSKDGLIQWKDTIPGNCFFPTYDNTAFDAIENSNGNYYALVGDTLYEFDNAGVMLRKDSSTSGQHIIELQNGNLVIQKSDSIICKSFAGNVNWIQNSVRKMHCTNGYLYVSKDSSVSKIDTSNGNVMWTKTYPWPIADLSIGASGSFVACVGNLVSVGCPCHEPGVLIKADAAGDTLWTRSFNFPYYGLSDVVVTDSSIITGGGFVFKDIQDIQFPHEYNCFIAALDTLGKGRLQTTENIWPGNSNNDGYLNFSEDALYMVLDFGKSGLIRDTIGFLSSPNGPYSKSDYAADWPDTSVSGPNLKYSDFNGDGFIDSSDVLMFYYTVGDALPLQGFRLSDASSASPTLYIVPERDSIAPGDTIIFNIILGSQAQPFDTICGVAFTGLGEWYWNIASERIFSMNSDLGIIGTDLYNAKWRGGSMDFFLSCRTDHQDVYSINDTIGWIQVVAKNNITMNDSLYFYPYTYNAIKCNGDIVPINLVTSAAVIDTALLSVKLYPDQPVKFSPNPASEILNLVNGNFNEGLSEINIYSLTGSLRKKIQTTGSRMKISVDDLENGIYILEVQNKNFIYHHSFAVIHDH